MQLLRVINTRPRAIAPKRLIEEHGRRFVVVQDWEARMEENNDTPCIGEATQQLLFKVVAGIGDDVFPPRHYNIPNGRVLNSLNFQQHLVKWLLELSERSRLRSTYYKSFAPNVHLLVRLSNF